MQLISLSLVTVLLLIAGLVIALAILASPILAAVVFVIIFGGFLVWRGYRRAEADGGRGGRRGFPPSRKLQWIWSRTRPRVSGIQSQQTDAKTNAAAATVKAVPKP